MATVENWELLKRLGEGFCGDVYLARHLKTKSCYVRQRIFQSFTHLSFLEGDQARKH